MYLLNNFAVADVAFISRYATEMNDAGYLPARRDHELYELYAEVVDRFRLEVLDMTCELVPILEDLVSAVFGIKTALQAGVQPVCCWEPTGETWEDGEPEEGEPEELCALAHSFALAWEAGCNQMYHQWVLGAFPALGVLQAIFDEFEIPGETLLEMVTLGASEALPLIEGLWQTATAALVLPITCAIYNSPGSFEAQQAIFEAIERQIEDDDTVRLLMRAPVTFNGLNSVYDGTFPLSSEEAPVCEEICLDLGCGGPLFEQGCDPGELGECGSGDQSPGLARVWTASSDQDGASYSIYSRLDTNREVTIVSAPGWTPKEGQPECRWFVCIEGELELVDEIDDPTDLPIDTCLAELVVIGASPFILVVNVGDECEPEEE